MISNDFIDYSLKTNAILFKEISISEEHGNAIIQSENASESSDRFLGQAVVDQEDGTHEEECLIPVEHQSEMATLEDEVIDEEESARLRIAKLGYTSFRSEAQKQLIMAVLEGKESVVGVLPTGSGKTLAIFVALTDTTPGSTVVIYPLRSVFDDAISRLEELSRRFPQYRHAWRKWDKGLPLQELVSTSKLILVTAEQANEKLFMTQIRSCASLIKRVVFDEAPVFITSHYRLSLSELPVKLRASLACPFILLTATLQPKDEKKLLDDFFCPALKIIRGPTIRPEIKHSVVKLNKHDISVEDLMEFVDFNADSLTIIFVKSLEKLENIFAGLQHVDQARTRVVKYHGSLHKDQRILAANEWKSGAKPIMIATTAFAFGIHDDNCRNVIHIDGAYDIDSYVQAAGRGGRDGRNATSLVIMGNRKSTKSDFDTYVDSRDCRLATISKLLDPSGLQWEACCGECDTCLVKGNPATEISEAWRSQSCMVYRLGHHVDIVQERTVANRYVAKSQSNLRRLIKEVLRPFCFTCFALSCGQEKSNHLITACPRWKYRCFRCGARGCKRHDCTKGQMIKRKLASASLCFACALPPHLLNVVVHMEQGTMGTNCNLRDSILPAMLLMWHDTTAITAIRRYANLPLLEFEDYLSWALQPWRGMTMYLHFLLGYIGMRTGQ